MSKFPFLSFIYLFILIIGFFFKYFKFYVSFGLLLPFSFTWQATSWQQESRLYISDYFVFFAAGKSFQKKAERGGAFSLERARYFPGELDQKQN